MNNKRLIVRLDIKNNAVVKGINMEGLRVIGEPKQLSEYYYESGVDELIYVDVVASLYNRNSITELIRSSSNSIFIPVCAGGGIRNLFDIDNILSSGADKVTLNTAAVNNVKLITEAATKFGSSTVVSAIETLKYEDDYYVFTDNGREYTGITVRDWINRVQDCGAGEILLSSISHDGTGVGFDYDLLHRISDLIKVPLVVHGGAGRVSDICDVLDLDHVDGACISSIVHYHPQTLKIANTEDMQGNTSFKESGRQTRLTETAKITEIKAQLNLRGHGLR